MSRVDLNSSAVISAYDELPLWSAMFGLLMLKHVPLRGVQSVLDVGCGTGFPLIELAERLGPGADVHGIDPWVGALKRADEKIAVRGTPNVTLHEGSAAAMPFGDATFDLIVSNCGINNFEDRKAVIRECARVARPGATIALTTNLQGHMKEFYDAFADVLPDDASRARLREHVASRATVESVRALLASGGFAVTRVEEESEVMRFADGRALLSHYFIRLGFLEAWEAVDGDALARVAERFSGEISLTIPMAYIEGRA